LVPGKEPRKLEESVQNRFGLRRDPGLPPQLAVLQEDLEAKEAAAVLLALGERPELGLETGERAKAESASAFEALARNEASFEDPSELLEPPAETVGVESASDGLGAHLVIIGCGNASAGESSASAAMIVLETERLVLRRMDLGDAEFIVRLLNDPSFVRFIGDRRVRSLDDAREYISKGPVASYERLGFGLYLTALKDGGTPIGICGLLKRESLPHPDIGFAFLPPFWSRGYAFEAASAVMAYGRESLGLARIVAVTSPDNEASIRLLRKLGMSFESRVRLSEEGPELELYAA